MSTILSELLSRKIEVYTIAGQTSYTDRGVLSSFDTQFLRLQKGDNDILYLNINRIRLIKQLD